MPVTASTSLPEHLRDIQSGRLRLRKPVLESTPAPVIAAPPAVASSVAAQVASAMLRRRSIVQVDVPPEDGSDNDSEWTD